MALESKDSFMEDIKCLEMKLSHLQERFDVIVAWIRSQYCELIGLPDYVLIAVRGDPTISDGRNEFRKIEHVKLEYDNFDDSIEDTAYLNDDTLADHIATVKEDDDILIDPVSSGLNLPSTTVHEESFPFLIKGNVNLNCENDQLVSTNNCNKDRPSSVTPKIKRVIKNAKHIEANRQKGLVLDADEYKQRVALLPKDRLNCVVCSKGFPTTYRLRRHEFEVHLTKEDQNILRNSLADVIEKPTHHLEPTNDRNKTEENNDGNLYHTLNDFDPSPSVAPKIKRVMKNAEHIEANREKGLVLDADEYKQRVASLPIDRLNCVVCSKGFPTTFRLRRHELDVHLTKEDQNILRNSPADVIEKSSNLEPTICDICNLPFKNMRYHKASHLPPEVITTVEGSSRPQYRCLKCNSLFPVRKMALDHHKLGCRGEELQDSTYNQKLRTEKNFLCNQCGQAFNRKYTLKIHIDAVHAKRKDFKCKFCPRSFTVENVKNNHQKKHLGMLSVNCDLCGFKFACKRGLLKHIKGVHENHRPYQCQLCEKSFKTAHARKYHLNTHGDPNGRKRGLNRDVDPIHAASKRRNCITWKNNRVQPIENLDIAHNEKAVVAQESEEKR